MEDTQIRKQVTKLQLNKEEIKESSVLGQYKSLGAPWHLRGEQGRLLTEDADKEQQGGLLPTFKWCFAYRKQREVEG